MAKRYVYEIYGDNGLLESRGDIRDDSFLAQSIDYLAQTRMEAASHDHAAQLSQGETAQQGRDLELADDSGTGSSRTLDGGLGCLPGGGI